MGRAQSMRLALGLLSALAVPSAAAQTPHTSGGLPPALQPVLLQTLARDAGPAHQVGTDGCAELRGPALRGCFAADGTRFMPAGSPALTLRLAAVGRDDNLVSMATTAPSIAGNRVEYRHPNVVEWWQILSVGFEQGFTFSERPAGRGDLTLVLDASRPGAAHGGAVAWGSLRYGALVVTDRDGRVMPATMETIGERLVIAVNDAGAVYPLTVDPLVWVEQRVTASDGGGQF